MKEVVSKPHVLALLDFVLRFTIAFDESVLGIGAVLMQQNRTIGYFS